ncbi:MAG: redoxin domain-containing protein [Bacteroidota bacterium]
MIICLLAAFKNYAQTPAQTIPEFTFYRLDKTPFTNKNVTNGKEVLFIFFDVTCDHCQHTISTLNKRISECKKISIYLISLEDKTAITSFFNLYGKNLPGQKNVTILQDSKEQFITQFNPRKYPSVFLYSAQKKLRLYDDEDQYLEKFFKIITTSKK